MKKQKIFQRHPSNRLNKLFINNYQGVNPLEANFVFVGKDPNFAHNIEDLLIFKYIEEYLNDGIQFIESYKAHHPFVINNSDGTPAYKEKDGKRYHSKFAKLTLPVETLRNITFVELIGFPTTGIARDNPKLFREYLYSDNNRDNLKKLDAILNARDKKIFIAWGLLRYFKELNKKGLGFDRIAKFTKEGRNQYDVHEFDENYIIHPHFSNAISNKNIADMSAMIRSKS